MFLNKLNTEEKIAFLELAHHIARSDGDFSDDEKSVINTYCMEMQINDAGYVESTFNLENTLSIVKTSQSKKIVLMEIMALIYSDEQLHEAEKAIIDIISLTFNVSNAEVNVCREWSKSILALFSQGQAIIEL